MQEPYWYEEQELEVRAVFFFFPCWMRCWQERASWSECVELVCAGSGEGWRVDRGGLQADGEYDVDLDEEGVSWSGVVRGGVRAVGLREFLMGCLWSVDIQLMFVGRACMYQVDVPGGAARGDAGAVLVRGAGRGAVVRGGGGEGLFW